MAQREDSGRLHGPSYRNARSYQAPGTIFFRLRNAVSHKVFVLSPARCDGRRAQALLNPGASFPLAVELRQPGGARLGEIFAFLSGLYFRGKLTYARAFATADAAARPIRIITTNRGLLAPEDRVGIRDIVEFSRVDLSEGGEEFQGPLVRDAEELARAVSPETLVILLGSIATNKYCGPLLKVFGDRLVFPGDFVGRADMSRGGLMLRYVQERRELEYIPVSNAVRHGKRPPKLPKLSARSGSGR
jgi:hypothetical protein